MKTLARRILRRFDLDIVRTHTTFEGHLTRLLAALDVNLVLDVGAHHGEYACLLRELGYSGRIASFEPVAATHAELTEAMRRFDDWKSFNIALGNHSETRRINVTAATDQSSFLTPTSKSREWFGDASTITRTENVRIERLDDMIQECIDGITDPRVYLKLDTQGFDTAVIEGGRMSIERFIVGMQTEIAAQPLYDDMTLFPNGIQPFMDLGFEVTGLFAVSRDPRDMIAAIEYDLVLRRRSSSTGQPGTDCRTTSVRGLAQD